MTIDTFSNEITISNIANFNNNNTIIIIDSNKIHKTQYCFESFSTNFHFSKQFKSSIVYQITTHVFFNIMEVHNKENISNY